MPIKTTQGSHGVRESRGGWMSRALTVCAAALALCLGGGLSLPLPVSAQTAITVDAYLHGSGGTANPPTLTADLLPSISLTTKTKDSASLAFSGGNTWKVIGSWAPPVGANAAITLSAFTTSRLWLGFRASADVGGRVDLLTEVLVNGQVLSTGTTRCISTLTSSASSPQDIATTFNAIPVTTINPATDMLAIRYSARMGTNTNGTACGTKASVTGVRAYFDSLLRLSRVGITIQLPPPTPVALLSNPRSIKTGATGTLTAILFPAPLQAGTLTVTSSNPAVATVPASVPVGTLQFLVPIPVTGVSAGTSVITATMNGQSAMSTVRVTGSAVTVTSLTPPALSITQGGTGQLTVTINAVQSTNTVVAVTSSAASVAAVPATVTVPAGQTTAPVPVAANTVGQATITASLNGTTATSRVTVTSASPTVVSMLPPTSHVTLGASGTLTVTISSAQVSTTTVTLVASPAGLVTLPPTVIVPANQTSATFSVTGAALGTAMLTASLNSSSVQAAVDVIPPVVQLTDLQPPTQNLVVGAIGTLTVSINAQQSSPTLVTLTVDQPTRLQIPPTVTVQPNQTEASFTMTALATGPVSIIATVGTTTKQATVVVIPQPPSVTALIPASLAVVQGATGQLTVQINAAQQTDTVVPLINSSPTILNVPITVTIPAGLTETPVQVTGLALGTAAVTATLNGTATSTVTVVAPPVLLTALAPAPPTTAPLTVAKGRSGILRVTINRVPVTPTIVTLTNANTNRVTVPATVTVPAGALFADFPVTTQNEGTATITATLNGSTLSAQVLVTAAEVDAIALAPANATAFVGAGLAYSATGTYTDGSTQPITSGLTWVSTSPAVADISTSGFASTLSPGSTTIRATVATSVGPVSAETTLTVQVAPALTLAPATANLLAGQAVTLTVTSATPAPTGGLTVTFSLSGSGAVTLNPLTVLIPQGQTNGTVQVTGTLAGTVQVTATAPLRTAGSSTLTISNPVPTLATINPTQVIAGGAPVTLTVTGTNFVTTSVVNLDGAPLTMTFVNATQLTAIIPAAAMASPHVASVTITNPAPGGGTSGALPLTIVSPVGLIAAISPSQVITGSAAFALSVTGSNFVGTSTVQLDGLNLVTAFASATQLTAQVPASALTTARAAQVSVTTPPPGGGTSNTVLLIINTPPIANAGRSQSATVGTLVTLDGRNSSDADNDLLTFSWVFASRPAGSAAALLNPTTVRPSFIPDVPGLYQVALDVNDGKVLSAPAVGTVMAVAGNSPANAEPGSNRAALIGQPATLDGRLSTDPDNDRLRYAWTILSAPVGSATALTNATSVLASVTPDLAGDYVVNLVVNDGTQDSAPVAVRLTATSGNTAPLANAGRDRNALANSLVTFDGSASRDPNPGTTLTYKWSLASVPIGSTATLTNPTSVAPTFTPMVSGDYLVRLVVNDGVVDSPPSTLWLRVASPNAGPNANAGGDQAVAQTARVTLNGTTSSDPNGDPLTYQWSLVSVPTGSAAVLTNPTDAQPTFVADLAGQYVVRLLVSDGTNLSVPDVVVIKAQAVTALAVTPINPSMVLGQTQPFVATATLADNSTAVLTNSVIWASSNPAVATMNANGLATSVAPGTTVITAAAGTITSPAQTLRVLPLAPTIGTITPATGPIGTLVTITGTNLLGSGPGTSTVRFNNQPAIITTITATSLTTTVPQGATSGLVTITTPGGTAIGAQPFTVTTTQDFSLAAAPGQVSVVRGQPTTAQIQVTNAGPNPVTGFISLAATGLPTGMSGSFIPSQIAGGQVATLTLNSGTAPTGLATITISATAVIDGQTIVRQSPLQVNVLAAGTTTLSGRILATKDDAPIPGARVKVGALSAITDASGNFLLTAVQTGPQVLLIDGPSALYPADLPVSVTITPNVANILSYPVYLHEVSLEYFPLFPGQATVIQPPNIPDFSMIIPAGTTIMGWDNQPNTRISVTRVPIDRLPLPPIPPDVATPWVYMYNFGKAGGGYPNRPIPIVFPNETDSPPGTRVDLWYYDESPTPDVNSNQWKIYGQGTVSEDGRQIVPDPGVGQPKFCCGGGFPAPARDAKGPGTDTLVGDPVSASTGMFHLEVTDLVLPGRIPLVIKRGYRSQVVPPVFPTPRRFPRILVNLEEFGINTALMEYDDRLTISGSTAFYVTGFERSLLTRATDGTFTSNRVPFLFGLIVRLNLDGTSTLREKNGTVRTFGSDGWLRSITDRNGNTVTVVRSGAQIQQIIEPGGRALTFTYNGGRIAQITDPIGRTVTYSYEINPAPSRPFTRLTEVRNPANGSTRYTYNSNDCITGVTDARGIQYLTNEYIPLATEWAISRQIQADGGVWQFNYILSGLIVTQAAVVDPRGNQTVHRFNGRGLNVVTVDALGQQTRKTIDFTTNQVVEIRDPLNRLTKFTYDLAGNVNSVLDPQQNPTLFEYEPTFNRATRITDALNQNTRFTYDSVTGNLLTTIDPLNHATAISYNQFGQPITVTDALNNTTTFEYDDVGNLIATIDPLGNRALRFYDAVARLVAVVDARGKSTQFTYDALNRVTQIQDAINGTTAFTYDPNGNLLTVTDAKSQTTTYTYDNMDRLATRMDALNRTESYQYDLAGNLTQFTDRKNQVTAFQYDALNRRISATYADATTTFTYDTVGRLVKANDTAPGGGTIDLAFDILDRLIQEVTPQGTVAYQYDVLGRRTQMVVNGQQPTNYQYDVASRLTRVAQGSLFAALGYDNANRRASLSYSNGITTSYVYDLASRLMSITHNGQSGVVDALSYSYDVAGNRFSADRTNGTASLLPSAVASASYDAANEQTQFGGATLTYDDNGNLTNDGVNIYRWDARNRLIGISDGSTASFTYDPLGRRASKTLNGTSTQFVYDGNDITAEIGGEAVTASYLRNLNIDEMFGIFRQEGAYFSLYDGLSSTLALTEPLSTPAVQYTYEPFGKTRVSAPSFGNPFQFTGRENDSTELYYYRTRYFSPRLTRFISQDRMGFGGGTLNLYAYASNNPVNYSDPLGLWSTAAHNYFLMRRFGDIDPQLLAQIMAGSQAADDWLTLFMPSFSPEHAMTPIGGNKKKAKQEMCSHISNHMNQFRHYLNNDAQGLAYFHLGMALHTVMDSTSPLHQGMQRWPSNITSHGSRGEGLGEINPEIETQTLNLMGAVSSGDYSVLGCGK